MAMTPISIRNVVDAGLCSGCGACAMGAGGLTTMEVSAEGFLRPSIDGAASRRTDASQICPGVDLEQVDGDKNYNPLWGPVKDIRTGYSTDSEVRFIGSSGGILSALSIGLVENGLVSFVWQTRAGPEDPIGNHSAPSRTRADILAAAGSRYGPSSPLADLEDALATGEKFAFVGKPCDVAALRKLAKVDPRIDQQIPYKLSFFCAGIPSRHATVAVLAALDARLEDVKTFRYRGEGWPGLARVTRHDGTTSAMDYNASWGTILNRQIQFRCKLCPDGTGEFADISCADAWFGKDGYPDFEEREGRSLIVVRTEVGARLLSAIEKKGYISSTPLDVSVIEAMQPFQASRKRNTFVRKLALLTRGRLVPRYKGFGLLHLALRGNWLSQFRNFVGMWRRAK